jgi:hypothetical protein
MYGTSCVWYQWRGRPLNLSGVMKRNSFTGGKHAGFFCTTQNFDFTNGTVGMLSRPTKSPEHVLELLKISISK